MDRDLWLERWEQGQTRFHRSEPSAALVANEDRFLGGGPHRVLVPLCGKSVDLPWLVSRGHTAIGVELAEKAVRALFDEHGLAPIVEQPIVEQDGPFLRFVAGPLTVHCGDVFALDRSRVGPVDRIWDRAALIALPPDLRVRYAARLRELAPGATMLLETLHYDPTRMSGPPFSVSLDEVQALYGSFELLDERDIRDEEERWTAHDWVRNAVVCLTLPGGAA